MDAIEYLKQIERIDRLTQNKLDEIEHWKTVASSVTVAVTTVNIGGEKHGLEKVQSTTRPDKMATAVCNYVDIEAAYRQDLADLAEARRQIIKTIEQLPLDEYDVLYKRYIENKQVKEIAIEMKKSRSWITTTHRSALKSLQTILDARA